MIGHDVRKRRQAYAAACLLLPAAFLLVGVPAAAQPTSQPPPTAKTFAADFFAPFNPVTAEDMIRRLPGFVLDNGEDRRGFAGAAGNVLINGERPSSKTPLSEQLSRISARDVLRIDLSTGGDGADLGGQTLIADVRLRPRDTGATNTFVVQASQMDPSGNINPLVVLTSGTRLGDVNLNFALQAQPARRGRIEYDKEVRSASGALVNRGPEFLQGSYWEYKLSGRASWKAGEADAFNANLQLTPSRDGRHTFSETYNATGALTQVDDSKVTGDNAWAVEAGGDWEHKLSEQASFKLIGLLSGRHTGSSERYSTRFTSGAFRNTLIERGADAGEYVGRGVFTWKPGGGHSLDWGGEMAFNYLESALDIEVQTATAVIDGTPPVANTRVEEERAELFLTDYWQVAPGINAEFGLTVETSKITQSGDASQAREFTYYKPRAALTWSIDEASQLRMLLERDVAQLDFSEFASSVSLFDSITNVGNPNLEPERTWRATVEWEQRFGPKGVVSLTAFHDEVEAVQDQVPIAGQFDGPGNLGDGRRTGLKLDATAPLDFIGLAGGEVRLSGKLQQTSVVDPVTGVDRRFSDEPDWSYTVDFRHPLPAFKALWGFLYERSDEVDLYRLKEFRTTGWDEANLDFYIETTAFTGLVVRFTVADVFRPEEVRTRNFYTPDRTLASSLSSIETRRATGGYGTRTYGVRISGRF